MTGKTRVLARHRGATSTKGDAFWHVNTADGQLLGTGTTAGQAWWNAYVAMRDADPAANDEPAAPPATSWPFPVSAHQEAP